MKISFLFLLMCASLCPFTGASQSTPALRGGGSGVTNNNKSSGAEESVRFLAASPYKKCKNQCKKNKDKAFKSCNKKYKNNETKKKNCKVKAMNKKHKCDGNCYSKKNECSHNCWITKAKKPCIKKCKNKNGEINKKKCQNKCFENKNKNSKVTNCIKNQKCNTPVTPSPTPAPVPTTSTVTKTETLAPTPRPTPMPTNMPTAAPTTTAPTTASPTTSPTTPQPTLPPIATLSEPAFSFAQPTNAVASAQGNDASYFTPTADIAITALGMYDHNQDGLPDNNAEIGLYEQATQTLLTSVAIGPGTDEGFVDGVFRYKTITCVPLSAGTTYVVSGYNSGGSASHVKSVPGIVMAPEIGYGGYSYNYQSSLKMPTSAPDSRNYFFGPGFMFVVGGCP